MLQESVWPTLYLVPPTIFCHKYASSFKAPYWLNTNDMITIWLLSPFRLSFREPVPSYYISKPTFLYLEPIISVSILATDP